MQRNHLIDRLCEIKTRTWVVFAGHVRAERDVDDVVHDGVHPHDHHDPRLINFQALGLQGYLAHRKQTPKNYSSPMHRDLWWS